MENVIVKIHDIVLEEDDKIRTRLAFPQYKSVILRESHV